MTEAPERHDFREPLARAVAGCEATHALGIVDRSRCDAVAPDAVTAPVDGEIFHEHIDARFCGTDVRLHRVRHERLARRDEDDRSTRRFELLEGRARCVKRADEIDLDDRFKAVGTDLLGECGEVARRTADERADRAERFARTRHCRFHGGVIADVGCVREDSAAE